MKLTILGCGTHIPEVNKCNPGYLLDIEGETLLLDMGSGIVRQIVIAGRNIWEIDKIFLSHLHIDHIIDLIPLFFTYKYQLKYNGESKIIPIYAHSEFEVRLNQLKQIYGDWINSEKRQYFHKKIEPGTFHTNKYTLSVFLPNHSSHSLIYRFEDSNGKIFVYTGDTGLSEGLIRAAYSADVLLVECSCRDEFSIECHMTPSKVKKLIETSKPKKVIITHVFPDNDDKTLKERIGVFKNTEISIARDLMEINF